MEYLFYSVIGKHASETVSQIINRKQNEVKRCGFSLWSVKIDKKSVEQVWKLKRDEKVVVFCVIKENAKDPVINRTVAKKMIQPNQTVNYNKKGMCETITMDIPNHICATFTENKNYQAYVVSEYEILNEPLDFNFGPYESLLSNGKTKSFMERFKFSRFQNTFGKLNPESTDVFCKQIMVKMHLQYPYVVNIIK